MTAASDDARIRDGQEACRRGDAQTARQIFELVAQERDTGEVHEGLAQAHHLGADYAAAMAAYERAYLSYRRDGDLLGAARAARSLGWLHGSVHGQWAVYGGWVARARTLLEQAGEDGNEHGWVLVAEAQGGGDLHAQERLYLEAIDVARRCGDGDLECEALASLGIMLVLSGFPRGLRYLDEALASVCAGEVGDVSVAESVFCGLFNVCERTNDVVRAEQWLRAADDVSRRRRLSTIGGYCRAYYGGLLVAAGRWPEAEDALTAALRSFPAEHEQIRANVLCRLADLRLRQGRAEEAGQLLTGLGQHESAVRPLAALHLARGETALAQDLLERSLTATGLEDATEGALLALLVDVHLAAGAVEDAARVADRLSGLAAHQSGDPLKAVAALARGRLCIATGAGDARACLHEALTTFARAHLPVDAAQTQLELARDVASTCPEVAVAHASSAHEAFSRAGARRDADAAAALLRLLGVASLPGPRGSAPLTRREAEVLELLGHGLTNAEIADRLFISAKTVEHHVGRILAKLGLRNRAQAVAHAVRTG
ncbi:LuxR C-terminal-related transcriptional regulator [Geodermatophilus sp. URMC 64]